MLARLASLFRNRSEDDPAALAAFLARQAAFVTQKTVIDYCRVKAGRREIETFSDPDFIAALRHCRWQTYAGAASDMVALAEAWLRPHARGHEAALASSLAALCAPVLLPPEAPEEARPSLESAREALPRHLALLQEAPPLPADRLPLLAEAPLLATLPVHPDQRRGETPAIRGALRFHTVSTQQEMERAFDPAGLARRLLGG
jgi:hypothetical protein